MKKIIRKQGSSLGIIFNRENCEILNVDEGDIIEFTVTKITKKVKGKKKSG